LFLSEGSRYRLAHGRPDDAGIDPRAFDVAATLTKAKISGNKIYVQHNTLAKPPNTMMSSDMRESVGVGEADSRHASNQPGMAARVARSGENKSNRAAGIN
jgi:hypothetical protein